MTLFIDSLLKPYSLILDALAALMLIFHLDHTVHRIGGLAKTKQPIHVKKSELQNMDVKYRGFATPLRCRLGNLDRLLQPAWSALQAESLSYVRQVEEARGTGGRRSGARTSLRGRVCLKLPPSDPIPNCSS